MRPLDDRVACTYSRIEGDERTDIPFTVFVTWSTPNYGGQRAWLHCAKTGCGRRCGRLFLKDPYVVCQPCAGVRYPSQVNPQPKYFRWANRAKEIRGRLEGPALLFAPRPPKPPGMHRRTYERLVDELETAESLFLRDAKEQDMELRLRVAEFMDHLVKQGETE
jgi:hypothetical protein